MQPTSLRKTIPTILPFVALEQYVTICGHAQPPYGARPSSSYHNWVPTHQTLSSECESVF